MHRVSSVLRKSLAETLVKPERLLIVDDENRIRSSIRLLLNGLGAEIVECENGCDAISALENQDFDVVLLDINLPDISGLEVMEWIFSNKVHVSVIFVSADDCIDSAILALRRGAVEYVRKPNELEDLPHKVESILYRRRLERSNAQMMMRLEQSEYLHRFLVESSPDLIYTLDHKGHFTYINNRVESLLGFTSDELIGSAYSTIVHEDDLERACYAFNERRRDTRAVANLEVRLKCKNKTFRHFEHNLVVSMLSATAIYEEMSGDGLQSANSYVGTYGVARDITERKIAEETISFQAFHDQLTHLPNQRLFKDRLEMAINQVKRHGGMVGVMFIDLDRFKMVNDTYGHSSGDELLKGVALRLRLCMRAGDTLARKGGDEFTVLLPDMVKTEDATVIAEKIIKELGAPFKIAGQLVHISASIGISILPRDGENADIVMKNADIAMYKVKATGKNGFKYFVPAMNESSRERINLEHDLRQALYNSEFLLHYQPQVSVSKNEIVGMEALIRWNHPTHGLMNPGGFIELAEETGLIGAITDWTLGEACRQLADWREKGLTSLRMAVNVSPQEFDRNDIIERILPHLAQNLLPADSLEIEITENILLREVPSVISKMRILRSQGIAIAIDDFGTCYSSLNYLRLFPVSTIKIDQSFVRDLNEDNRVSPVIQAIIGIARGYGMNLLAEGVETESQLKILRELGCDEMQGFIFSKALPAADAERLLLSGLSVNTPGMPTVHIRDGKLNYITSAFEHSV
ncbi:MAG: EAL domain-containing protein [Desulfuromonadaceae bacterium]|nr:EAL domain-containing protein [Desulfuromonadaceae bacterium]MDD5107247.1 EAL domain-containing protein [Desulfuromonadaceae bacterium]